MKPSSFRDVLKAELEYVRSRRFGGTPPRRVKDGLIGVALSGGGIRSATTNLGVLQGLSKLGILPLVDYLCTVSGGGYIGSCLSSLLSLDNPRARPPANQSQPPGVLKAGDVPLFSTGWRNFPFNPDSSLGADQMRHLRTHGSFLVTRKGVLKRETLRSIGQLLSGTVYHLVLVLLTLSAAALLYITFLFASSWKVDEDLRKLTGAVPTYAVAFEATEESATEPTREAPGAYTAGTAGERRFNVPIVYVQPTLWERLKIKTKMIWQRVQQIDPASRGWWAGGAAAYGALITVVAFLYLRRYRRIVDHLRPGSPAKPGESADEALAVRILRRAGWASLAAVVLSLMIAAMALGAAGTEKLTPIWLILPLIIIAAIRVTSWIFHLFLPRMNGTWTLDMRSLWSAYQATAVYALWAAIVLAAVPILVYALREHGALTALSGVFSLLIARLVTPALGEGSDAKKRRLPRWVPRVVLGLAIGIGLLLLVVAICIQFVPERASAGMWITTAWWFAGAVALVLFLGIVGDANMLSPHYFYRDRLAEAYLCTNRTRPNRTSLELLRDNAELRLASLHGETGIDAQGPGAVREPFTTAPYHLISCAVNLAGSRDLTRKDRKSGYFTLSKYFCGSRHTGYRPTNQYMGGDLKLGRAVTISGAAASSGIGAGTFFAQAFAMVLFNLRLGYWMPNPSKASSASNAFGTTWHFWPKWLWREVAMATDERRSLVNLSDGGHTGDNVGIYPLLQRRCKLIIACDAECDPSLAFGSFTEAIRHAYIDLGIDIDIDLTMLRPDRETGMSRSHCAVGLIRYPATSGNPPFVGYLVYLKNSLTGDEPEPVLNYKSENPVFPHESTADQFFSDAQFESYRALGERVPAMAPGHSAGGTAGGLARRTALIRWINQVKARVEAAAAEEVPATVDEFVAAESLDKDFEADAEGQVAMERALEILRGRHLAFRRPEKSDLADLEELRLAILTAVTESLPLEPYYREAWGLPRTGPDVPEYLLRPIAVRQIELMTRAFHVLQLHLFANARENHGWMTLFRSWGRSAHFNTVFDELEPTLSPQFTKFYNLYLRDLPARASKYEVLPIHHPWLTDATSKRRGRGLCMDSGRVDEIDVRPGAGGIVDQRGSESANEPFEKPSDSSSEDGKDPAPNA